MLFTLNGRKDLKIMDFKKIFSVITPIIFIFLTACPGFPQLMDKYLAAATVNLTNQEIITVKQLEERIAQLEAYGIKVDNKKMVLEDMIAEILLKQAAVREGISVSESDVITAIRSQIGTTGLNLSDYQLRTLVQQQTGVSWNDYLKRARDQLMIQKYVRIKKADIFEKVEKPSEKEIRDIYNENSHLFINPEMVRFSQIYRDTRNLTPEEKRKARNLMYEIHKQLENGESTFEKLVEKYSDDKESRYRGGDVGYLAINDRNAKSMLGEEFFDAAFSTEAGEITEVIESNIGYHILRITEHRPRRFLNLDDPVSPASKETVRERIIALKTAEQQEKLFERAVNELVEDLKKKEAIVKIFEENLK